jgi:signal transduction histidine kinase
MRRDFIANVSHELRTPLTVVGGFVETLADAPALPRVDTQRYYELMLDNTRRMQRLLDDLLTLSRLESADNNLKEERVNVPEMVRSLESEAQSLSRGRHAVHLRLESARWVNGRRRSCAARSATSSPMPCATPRPAARSPWRGRIVVTKRFSPWPTPVKALPPSTFRV